MQKDGNYNQDRQNRNNANTGKARMTWKVREHHLGGRPIFHDNKYYTYGQILPKLPSEYFKEFRDAGYIEPNESLGQQ